MSTIQNLLKFSLVNWKYEISLGISRKSENSNELTLKFASTYNDYKVFEIVSYVGALIVRKYPFGRPISGITRVTKKLCR